MRWGFQDLLEAEVSAAIGATRHERCPDERSTHRNGYRQRLLTTQVGDLSLAIPKLRQGSFFPDWLEPRRRVDKALYAVVMEAYTGGISTRKVDALVEALGGASGISKSEVSRICQGLDEQVKAFLGRTLDHARFPYVYLDATYLHGRLGRNMQVVSVYTFAFANYFGKQPIRSIDDIKGKKFRVNATAAERAKMRQLGGTAVPMDLSEVIPGLQQGVIDGTQSATAVYVNMKFNEINKSLTESNDTMVVSVGVISRAFLNRLPPDLRQLVIDEGAKVQARMMSRSRQLDEEARKRWSDAGGEWLRFSAADQGRMRTLLSGIGAEVTKDNAQVNAFYKRMLSTSQKF